jgi:hypothetical protein
MTTRDVPALLVVLASVGCASSPEESHGGTATAGTSSGTTTTDAAESSSSTTADPGDPDYPRPDPVELDGTCPDESFGPITFDSSAWICIPECGDESSCPSPATGTAEAVCATNPYSSASPCETSEDCTVDGEMCGNIGGAQKGCLLPPSHCILRCDAEHVCPDEMTCTVVGVCGYSP